MKKLMTMIAAVATAFGLYAGTAEFKNGTGFETTSNNDPDGIDYAVGKLTSITDKWTVQDDANDCMVTAGDPHYEKGCGVPERFENVLHSNYLAIKTALDTNKALIRTVSTDLDSEFGLYYDSLVNFTAFDAEDTPPEDATAKIAVWLRDNGDSTNLMVRAYSTAGNNVEDYE